jgi:Gpi18-like mannosyltransferase
MLLESESTAAQTVSPALPVASKNKRRRIRVGSLRSHPDWQIAAVALAAKALVFVFGAEAYQVLSNERPSGFEGWLGTLNRWDTVHYINIAEHGYRGAGTSRDLLAFLPGYPWAVRAFSVLIHDYLISGLFVSAVATVAAALLLYRLAVLDLSPALARRAAWFLLIFPTSYFLHFAYPESLFLALVLASILAARRELWLHCGILGALAGLTRINGLVLVPVLACEVVEQYRKARRFNWRFFWAVGPAAGFGVYLFANLAATGDALTFLAVQRDHWYKHLTVPWTGIRETVNSMRWRPPAEAQMVGTQELVFIVLGLACTIYCWVKLRRAYAIWMAGNWFLFTCTSFIYSVPRYTLTMFPIFMVFALVGRNKLWSAIVTLWSVLFLSLFTGLFVRGQWAF